MAVDELDIVDIIGDDQFGRVVLGL